MSPQGAVLPRHDAEFVDRCLVDLMQHYGQWRRLGQLYAAEVPSFDRACVVRDAVERGRRLGLQIEGDCRGWASRGYRLVGFCHPERIYLVKPGGPSGIKSDAVCASQMSIADVLGAV